MRWPKYWSFSISPSNEYSGLIYFRIDWFVLLAVHGTLLGQKSLGQEDPLEEGMATHSSILAWRIHGQRSLVAYSPLDYKESGTTAAT